ncbi:GroES-like protein [Agrocybe pediades]|nr:GroES-like protein [Agrocybe pediades]
MIVPATQKALLLKEPFGDLVLDDIPVPTPKAGEILVKVHSVALNPADWKIPRYNVVVTEFPAILGCDVAGTVHAVGEGKSDFQVGDRVLFMVENVQEGGGFQQYVIFKGEILTKIPTNVSFEAAATLPLGLSTAYSGLYAQPPHGLGLIPPTSDEGFGKYKGNAIVILGGASSVGQAALQLARLSGFSTIITTASLSNEEALKELGATHVLDRRLSSDEIISRVAQIVSEPILYAYDIVTSEFTQNLTMDILSQDGHAAFASPVVSVKPKRSITIGAVLANADAPYNVEIFKELYQKKLYGWVESGVILPSRYEVLPNGLRGVAEGLQRMESDKISRLKLIVHPHDT